MTSSVSTTNNTALQQVMLMLQQMAQSTAANPVTTADADTGSVSGAGSASASSPALVSNQNSISGDMLLVLIQGQATSGSGATSGQAAGQQGNLGQDFQQMAQAIEGGNLSAAQQAYATVEQDLGSGQNGQTSASTSSNPFVQALDQIGNDLQSGNIAGAQQTLSSMQQAAGAHHHGGGGGGDSASSSSGSSSADGSSNSSTIVSETVQTNPDGSTTTLITYADGSTGTTTTPAAQSASGSTGDSGNPLDNLLASLEQALQV